MENLFDTVDAPGIDDAEFLPEGKHEWNTRKYSTKLTHIASVIKSMNEGQGADIVGLAEVENMGVVKDLIADPQLKALKYGIVHHESPDTRGIDVAMIYKKNCLRVTGTRFFHVNISKYDDKPTRDIVMVEGIDIKDDTLLFFLNHWSSRRGGIKETEPKRRAAAMVLKKAIDSIEFYHPYSKIIVMGDFNENPTDPAITGILHATKFPDFTSSNSLYNAANNFNWRTGEGTEWYHGDWSRFIQIIFSTSVIKNQLDLNGKFNDIHIFKPPWLMIEDTFYHQLVPYRTFEDGKPIGYSDHLPVYSQLDL